MMVRHVSTALAAVTGLLLFTLPAAGQLTAEDIARMNAEAAANGWTFTVAENEVTHLPLDVLCRAREPRDWRRTARWDACAAQRDLPTYWNWREEDPLGSATAIRNQGACGSCWIFGACGAVECNWVRVRHEFVDVSEQWFINCSDSGSCDGGWHTYAFDAMLCENGNYCDPCGDCGAVRETDCPYVAQNRPCTCPYEHPYCLEAWYVVGQEPFVWATVDEIKQAVYEHGPVATCMAVSGTFQSYHSGVYNNCTQNLTEEDIDHVIVIMGWDDNAGSSGAWIVRNSWGQSWGQGGYGMIEYDCDLIGYATAYVVVPGLFEDCNNNGAPDDEDIATGFSGDCNSNGIPDECDLDPTPPITSQPAYSEYVLAQSFADTTFPQFGMKQWDDLTLTEPTRLGPGQAAFRPETWGCYATIPFLVEIADAPGGAEAGGNVLASTTGTGASGGIVSWDFGGLELPAGTYWLSVQAQGGFMSCGMVYWYRANRILHAGSEHYFHNPGGGQGHGTDPAAGSTWWSDPADVAFVQRLVREPDCNSNGVLDACDIAAGASPDTNGNGVPDECEGLIVCPGDSNCDGLVNWRDVDYFVSAMNDDLARWVAMFAPTGPPCPFANNDINADGHVNWRDFSPIEPYLELMNTACE